MAHKEPCVEQLGTNVLHDWCGAFPANLSQTKRNKKGNNGRTRLQYKAMAIEKKLLLIYRISSPGVWGDVRDSKESEMRRCNQFKFQTPL